MAKPRIFISSTFYDLRQIRADLDGYIQSAGYETVLNEKGNIPYGRENKLEDYCYDEIRNVDILIALIGGRFGHVSKTYPEKSITQNEIDTALKLNKQVFIFIENSVFVEYQTFLLNPNNLDIKYFSVDSVDIFRFILHLHSLIKNNPIQGFSTSYDITSFLKEQWAGLFKTFLVESSKPVEINLIKSLEELGQKLQGQVQQLSIIIEEKNEVIREILLSKHPAFEQLKNLIKVKHRVYFASKAELEELLHSEKFIKINKVDSDQSFFTWYKPENERRNYLHFEEELFDQSNILKIFSKDTWNPKFIRFEIADDTTNWPQR